MTERQGMTWLQGLIVKIVMLAVAVGLLFGAVTTEKTVEPEQPGTAPLPAAAVVSEGRDERDDAGPSEPVQPDRAVQQDLRPVPVRGAAAFAPAGPASLPHRAVVFPLDINRAGAQDLAVLPGLGDILAQRVVAYRTRHGGFRRVDELRKVRGIGEKRMEQLRALVVTTEVP